MVRDGRLICRPGCCGLDGKVLGEIEIVCVLTDAVRDVLLSPTMRLGLPLLRCCEPLDR
jgi:hypothetical protein